MSRFVDRGAVTAGWVGIGMAVVVAISFLLVIPIEPLYWLLAIPSGVLIGYYANARGGRGGAAIGRVVGNAVYAGVVTGLAFALLLLGVKALFFFADDGYRDSGRLDCSPGAGCVYARYLAADSSGDLAEAGVTDAESFSRFYWSQQLSTVATLLGVTIAGAAIGGFLFSAARRQGGAAPGVA